MYILLCLILNIVQIQLVWSQIRYPIIHGNIHKFHPVNLTKSTVYVGRPLVLNCYVAIPTSINRNTIQYTWEHPEGVVLGRGKYFELPNVSETDGGMYTCISKGYDEKSGEYWVGQFRVHLDIKDYISIGGSDDHFRPNIILQPGTPGPLEWREGESLQSRCTVSDDELSYKFRWVRRLPNGQIEEISATDTLYLPSVRREQVHYPIFCQVTRLDDGSVFDEMLNLRVVSYEGGMMTEDYLQLIIIPLPAEDLSQGRVMRQCLFDGRPDMNEMFDFRWLDQNGRVVNNGDSLILLLDNLDDLKNYTCEAISRLSGVIYQAKYMVSRSSRSQDIQYTVSIEPLTTEVLVGQPYEMICKVDPIPDVPVTYTWYHSNQKIDYQPTIMLSSLSYPDIGQYICEAVWTPRESMSGSISANSTVEINLALTREIGIDLSAPPGSVLVTLPGEMRELHCEFENSRPRDVRWFFQGQPLEHHPQLNQSGLVHRVDRLRVSIVTLRSVKMAHAGKYECRYENTVRLVHVIVRSEAQLEINPSSETVDEGQSVEFHCRAHGASEGVNREIQWFYRPFYGGNMVRLDLNSQGGFNRNDDPYASHTSFISKLAARKSDEGDYICRLPSMNSETFAKLYVRGYANHRVTITPAIIRVRMNQLIEIECYVTDENNRPVSVQPRFRVRNSHLRYETNPIGQNRARFYISQGLDSSLNGTQVECYTDQPGNTAVAVIIIEGTCSQGYRRCRNGECLPAGRFCDGHADCSDRSDEDPVYCSTCDPIAKECKHVQQRPPLKANYMVHWECDGEDDCGNGFDEQNCPNPHVARCEGSRYTCSTGQHTIPLAYVCDKEPDCPNHEDERNCAIPTIQSISQHRYPVRVGSSVTLTCRVTGFPIPRVIWRFNWGCLPDDGVRYRVTSVAEGCVSRMPTVVSTLTINGLHHGDDGIYNCEALSGGTRAMSNDYHVIFEG